MQSGAHPTPSYTLAGSRPVSAEGSAFPVASSDLKVGYVTRQYPCFSETFIANEILSHEERGETLTIFSIFPSHEVAAHEQVARIRSPVLCVDPARAGVADYHNRLRELFVKLPHPERLQQMLPSLSTMEAFCGLSLAREVLLRGITHLHAHFANLPASITRVAAFLTDITYSLTAHAHDIYVSSGTDEEWRRNAAEASAVVTVSDYNARHISSHAGLGADRLHIVYNGVDLRRLAFSSPVDREPLIVAVGRLVPKKGFDVLLLACARLRDKGVAFQCEIAGAGETKPQLLQMIAELRLEDCVRLLGPVPQPALFDLLRRGAAVAVPSIITADGNREGLPTVLPESMALGTPCVATDTSGIPEAIRPGETGLLVPANDPASLAAALERLLTEPALRVHLAQNARALVEARFDLRHNAEALWRIFSARPALIAL